MAETTVLTDGGLAIWEATDPGTIQATGLRVKLGRAQRMPMNSDTDISMPYAPVKEFPVANVAVGVGVNASRMYFAVTDVSADAYSDIGEIGLFFDDEGEEKLFLYTSDPDAVLPYRKVAGATHTFRFQLDLNRTGTGESPIASSEISLFPATDRVHGQVRLATDEQRDLPEPPADRVLTARQARQMLDNLDLLTDILDAIAGNPTDGQIIDYDLANTRLRFVSLMTSMLASIEGDPTDGQIIDYDLANTRLRFINLMTSMLGAIEGDPTDGQIIDYDLANTRLRFVNLMTSMLGAIEGDPTDGQIIDYDLANTRLRFVNLMTSMLGAIHGEPTDGQIIDYDDANKRLRFVDKSGAAPKRVLKTTVNLNRRVWSQVTATESLAMHGFVHVWLNFDDDQTTTDAWGGVSIPGPLWDSFSKTSPAPNEQIVSGEDVVSFTIESLGLLVAKGTGGDDTLKIGSRGFTQSGLVLEIYVSD